MKGMINSAEYWRDRYEKGGHSGAGSMGRLAAWKAEVLNKFVQDHPFILYVFDLGCGDGQQAVLYDFPFYYGYDISEDAMAKCATRLVNHGKMEFMMIDNPLLWSCRLHISIDVIYHLVEDPVFEQYMETLFNQAVNYVIIYSTNNPFIENTAKHVKHRNVTNYVGQKFPDWKLTKTIENKFPYNGNTKETSHCNFYFFERIWGV